MPSSDVHRMDADIFGYSRRVNHIIDGPWSWLRGGHRVLFHDEGVGPNSAMAMGAVVDKEMGAFGGARHRYLDTICSANPEFREALEMMAKMRPPSRRRKGGIRITSSKTGTYEIMHIYEKADD